MLDRLPLGLGRGQPVGPGMSRLIGGLYRYSDDQFSVLSFQADVLERTLPVLAAVDVPDAAQVRARSGNLRGSQIEGWVNRQLYDRARQSSVAGASLLSLVTRQLGVTPEQAPNRNRANFGCPIAMPTRWGIRVLRHQSSMDQHRVGGRSGTGHRPRRLRRPADEMVSRGISDGDPVRRPPCRGRRHRCRPLTGFRSG